MTNDPEVEERMERSEAEYENRPETPEARRERLYEECQRIAGRIPSMFRPMATDEHIVALLAIIEGQDLRINVLRARLLQIEGKR